MPSRERKELVALALPPSAINALHRKGFRTVGDVEALCVAPKRGAVGASQPGLAPPQGAAGGQTSSPSGPPVGAASLSLDLEHMLAQHLDCPVEEAANILRVVKLPSNPYAASIRAGGGAGGAEEEGTGAARGGSTGSGGGGSARAAGAARGVSAKALFEKERAQSYIITFCQAMDTILGGGMRMGEVSEVCGVPGVGKTQLAMQLAVDAQIPKAFRGAEGQAVYLDTEGSFTVNRLEHMADAVVEHLAKIARSDRQGRQKAAAAMTTREAILSNVFYFRAHNHAQQLATIQHLDEFVSSHPRVRLVVVDSIAFHFRNSHSDVGVRNRQLGLMAAQLQALAKDRGVAVVVINHMTTKVEMDSPDVKLVPALGEAWSHSTTNRVVLRWQGRDRLCELVKSPHQQSATAVFDVTAKGIRDKATSGSSRGGGRGGGGGGGGGGGEGAKRSATEGGAHVGGGGQGELQRRRT